MNFQHLPDKKYDVILADPPWLYSGSPSKWGAAGKEYACLSYNELRTLPLPSLLAVPSCLFMWTTSAKMEEALQLLRDWGLYYRGITFVWVKTKHDGTPIAAQGVRPSIVKPITEFVIAGSTAPSGRPLKLCDEGVVQTIFAPKQEHSRKPDDVHQRLDRMYPANSKIELFARRNYPGWDVWGLEV